jgi:hypothetical protein
MVTLQQVTDLDTYTVTDDFFGAPYIDRDEWQDEPTPHRLIHGGFEGTDTRFSFYFPPVERYHGRLYQPLEGANAGHEGVYGGPLGVIRGTMEMLFRLGGYMIESNMGHIGDVMDPKAGPDPTIYGFRAAAESARFSKFVAAQVLGAAPHHSYVFGGSGGARRSPLCLEYAPDVWDGALPYMGGGEHIAEHGDFRLLRGGGSTFTSMFNVQRLLGSKIYDVVDAMQPGGSGDPFAGLDTHQREELANLYRLGYPRGDEFSIAQPMGQIWLWSSMAERTIAEDAAYFESFWTKPGYVGHDQPALVDGDLINTRLTVLRPLRAKEIAEDPEFDGPEFASLRGLATLFAGMHDMWDIPMALEVDGLPDGYRLGAGVRVVSGQAAGRQLYCISGVGNVLLCDGEGEASNLRFSDVLPGDEVQVDNRAFLAYCYYYRHHVMDAPNWDFLRVDGTPIYPQHELSINSPFMSVPYSGQFQGKLIWVHHTHDASLWPSSGIGYKDAIERVQGAGAAERFRLRWTENAEHGSPEMFVGEPNRATNTRLIDYQPIINQTLADLTAWVEEGVEPAGTNFEYDYHDALVTLPPTATERGGIQPVVSVTANGGIRAEVKVGEPVELVVHAEAPPKAGTIIAVAWDFDGSGTYPLRHDVDGSSSAVTFSISHSWDRPGTYFATALVHSHVDGDVQAIDRRLPNLAAARVIVT